VAIAAVGGGTLLTTMAVFGYGAYGMNCDSDILNSFNMDNGAVQVAAILLVIHLALYIPTAFIIMRFYFMGALNINVLQMDTVPFVLYSLLLFIPIVILMACIPLSDVGGVFAFTLDLSGDIPIGFTSYALPSAIYLKVFYEEKSWVWYAAAMILAFGVVAITLCPIVDIYMFSEACSSSSCDSY
jgi:hypothetical protein